MVPTGQVAEKQAYEEPRQDHELKSWRCLVFYLCFFGFMAQLRPGESFITPFLLERKFTMAARIAYSSYIFSLVHPSRYQRMASYSRAAVLLGVFISSVLGQALVTVGHISTYTLNCVSLGFILFSLVLSLFLKRPKRSLFFNRSTLARGALPCELDQMHPGPDRPETRKLDRMLGTCRDSFLVRMLSELVENARQPQLRLWCLWWVFNSSGYYLITYYVHVLWRSTDSSLSYNGAVDAASTLLSAITSFSAGFLSIRWTLWSKLVIAGVIAIQASLVFCMFQIRDIWVCYVTFVLFRGAYQFLVPIATFQIASSLSKELCALVFGINTFLATALKTCITLVVSDKRGLGLQVRDQFRIYFIYFLMLHTVLPVDVALSPRHTGGPRCCLLGAFRLGHRTLLKGPPVSLSF